MANTLSVAVQMEDILDAVTDDAQKSLKENLKSCANDSAQRLKITSPRKTGDYAKGWSVKKVNDYEYIVHNKTDYQLTHLLENGHVIKNKKGTYGRTHPIRHIAPVEEWAADELPRRIMEDIP